MTPAIPATNAHARTADFMPGIGTSLFDDAAQKQRFVRGQDARLRREIDARRPVSAFERSSEHDAVGPWKHVQRSGGQIYVADGGLGLENRQLAANRLENVVVEQLARAQARAVEDDRFVQNRNVG